MTPAREQIISARWPADRRKRLRGSEIAGALCKQLLEGDPGMTLHQGRGGVKVGVATKNARRRRGSRQIAEYAYSYAAFIPLVTDPLGATPRG